MSALTPDGLIIYEQPGVGLVVSAAEHNFMLAKWEGERAQRSVAQKTTTMIKPVCVHATEEVSAFIYDQIQCCDCGAYMGRA
jgi:hypothetical protein